jgi:flavin-dependent dehydrogenase
LISREVRDVVVIGAGPAGSMTARLLADAGHDVLLLEEHSTIGAPVHCTGLMGADAFDEFDLPKDSILSEAGSARFWGAAGQSVAAQSSRIQAVIIDRGAFDRRLAARAELAGAEIRRGCRAETVTVAADAVRVTTGRSAPPIQARVCVLACGASYRFHRTLGLGLPDGLVPSSYSTQYMCSAGKRYPS